MLTSLFGSPCLCMLGCTIVDTLLGVLEQRGVPRLMQHDSYGQQDSTCKPLHVSLSDHLLGEALCSSCRVG